MSARGRVQARNVAGVVGAGVDHDVAALRGADQVAVGAGAGHDAGVGRGQSQDVFQQRHGVLKLPVQRMHGLGLQAGQCQFAVSRVTFDIAHGLPAQQADAWWRSLARRFARSVGSRPLRRRFAL